MAKLLRKVVNVSTGGLLGKEKKPGVSSAERQARAVGASTGKASDKARDSSNREFGVGSVSSLLGGPRRSGFGGAVQSVSRRVIKRSR